MDDETSADSQHAAKRRKIKIACEVCRNRKVRCDGGRPTCGSCIRRQVPTEQCIYIDVAEHLEPDYVRSLEQRIRDLEQQRNNNDGQRGSFLAEAAPTAHDDDDDNHAPVNLDYSEPRRSLPAHLAPVEGLNRLSSVAEVVNFASPRRVSFDAPSHASTLPAHGTTTVQEAPLPAMVLENHNAQAVHASDLYGSQSGSAMGATEGGPLESGRMVFLGRSSAAAFMREVDETSGGCGLSVDNATVSSGPRNYVTVSRKEQEELNAILEKLILPPRRVADAYLSKYWEFVHTLYPVLHKPTFLQRYEMLWTHEPYSADENVHILTAFYATLNIVFALSCTFADPLGPTIASKRNAEVFYERSEALIAGVNIHQASIQLLQALILTSQYLQSTDLINKCWITVGIAIRTAQGIGIHLDLDSESQVERQERKRTWWCCVMMDRVLSMTFGRPPMVCWPTVVPLPDPVDDELLLSEPGSVLRAVPIQELSLVEFYIQALKLTNILMVVLKHLYIPLPEEMPTVIEGMRVDLPSLLDIDASLARWRRELPQGLVYRHHNNMETGSEKPYIRRQSLALLCRYLHLRILLFRQATVDFSTKKFFEAQEKGLLTDFQYSILKGCMQSCISAAQELIALIHSGAYAELNLPWWYGVFYLYTAGTVILAVRVTSALREVGPEHYSTLQHSLTMCTEALSKYGKAESSFARKCLGVLIAVQSHGYIPSGMASPVNDQHRFYHQDESGPPAPGDMPQFERYSADVPPLAPQADVANANHVLRDFFEKCWDPDWLNNLADNNFDAQYVMTSQLQ